MPRVLPTLEVRILHDPGAVKDFLVNNGLANTMATTPKAAAQRVIGDPLPARVRATIERGSGGLFESIEVMTVSDYGMSAGGPYEGCCFVVEVRDLKNLNHPPFSLDHLAEFGLTAVIERAVNRHLQEREIPRPLYEVVIVGEKTHRRIVEAVVFEQAR